MSLFYKLVKRKIPLALISGLIYLIILIYSIVSANNNYYIYYPIEAYIFGSDFPDFVFPIIVSLPFAYYSYYLSKNNFLNYVAMRIKPSEYIKRHIFSINIASIGSDLHKPDYSEFILGSMQINNSIAFGFLWSLHKALIGSLIALLGQIISLYTNNLFLALTGAFLYTMLENFLTATFGLQRFSLTTAFILNRLDPRVVSYGNILVSILVFAGLIFIMEKILRKSYEKKY